MTKPKKVEEPTAAYQPKPSTKAKPPAKPAEGQQPTFASAEEVKRHTQRLMDVHRDVLRKLAQ